MRQSDPAREYATGNRSRYTSDVQYFDELIAAKPLGW